MEPKTFRRREHRARATRTAVDAFTALVRDLYDTLVARSRFEPLTGVVYRLAVPARSPAGAPSAPGRVEGVL